ncbi:uncharacterized protein LOC112466243 [Temnothorax curvispinosus]|uniref:Uncharacterized protein LOC112466243 n=1 Tax=Temnothorax curvispinosus TaxID=300111 RepID=A0A6J1RAQ4_9HYME|nr:uncharacterized protein LOC112466243 [Temnothorax curvispinosus]
MSRMINKRDINNTRKRATIATLYTSTPTSIPNTSMKSCNISLSGIDTASSSSGDRPNLHQLQERKRHTKGKKREDTKWRMKDSDSKLEAKQKHQLIDKSLNVKRKKNLTSEKKAIKKKRILEDTDNEWETETEKSINESLIGSRGSIDDECIKLFQDPPCTPEKIRDRPIAYEENLHNYESPIICSHRKKRSHLISKKNDIILQDTLLPVNSLTTEVQSLEETGEDETIFQNNAQTHVSLRNPEKISKQKPENFSPYLQLRRDQSVKTYPGKKFRHSVSSLWSPINDFYRKHPNLLSNLPRKTESISIPPGMICVKGYWDKTLRKWIRYEESSSQNKNGKCKTKINKRNTKKVTRKQKYNVYDTTKDETDHEFETGGQDGKRMTFREFCRKQKEVIVISSSDTDM